MRVSSGNSLDVVYYADADGTYRIHGLMPHDSMNMILLPDPEGLILALQKAQKDVEKFNGKKA